MSVGTQSAGVTAATQIAKLITDRLAAIEKILRQQLTLSESSRKNFIGAGSVTGGGVIGVAPASIMGDNYKRRGLSVQNLGAAGNLSIGLGTTQPQANTGITLLPGAAWDGRVSGMVWLGNVSIVGSIAGVLYSWLEA